MDVMSSASASQTLQGLENPECASGAEAPTSKVLRSGLKHVWKEPGDQFSKHRSRCLNSHDNPYRLTWEKKQQAKNLHKSVKEVEQSMKARRSDIRRKQVESRRKKAEKKAENELRGTTVQVIKDATKLKKWSTKAKRALMNMPSSKIDALRRV